MKKKKVLKLLKSDSDMMSMKKEILKTDHKIIMTKNGVLRWKKTRKDDYNLNDIVQDFLDRGLTKNDEEWRSFYRSIGYSLYGYWEVFYWVLNNEDADEYVYRDRA